MLGADLSSDTNDMTGRMAGGSAAPKFPLVNFGELTLLTKSTKGSAELTQQDEARALLFKAAKQVEPIMKKRGWNVPKLIEIIPPSP